VRANPLDEWQPRDSLLQAFIANSATGSEAAIGVAVGAHEIKLDRYRVAARVDNGHAQLLTRTGLDWTAKYPSVIAALRDLV
jgi:bifunctional non-homologous end joining protein LigD